MKRIESVEEDTRAGDYFSAIILLLQGFIYILYEPNRFVSHHYLRFETNSILSRRTIHQETVAENPVRHGPPINFTNIDTKPPQCDTYTNERFHLG